jgi:hypothetical protein
MLFHQIIFLIIFCKEKFFVFCFVLHFFFEKLDISYGKMCIIITDPKQTSTSKISIDGENMLASELSNGKKFKFRLFKTINRVFLLFFDLVCRSFAL